MSHDDGVTMNSDGQYQQIAATVIAVLGLAVLLGYFNVINTGVRQSFEHEACKKQVQSHALALQMSGRQFASDISCGTKTETVENDVNRRVADAMRRCWDTFLEGRENLFKGEYTFCYPCAILTVEEQGSNFGEYLAQNEIPRDNQSYLEYLSGYRSATSEDVDINERIMDTDRSEAFMQRDLESGTQYAVLFTYAKGKDEIKTLMQHLQGESGVSQATHFAAGTALVAGASVALVASAPWSVVIGFGVTGGVATEIVGYFANPETAPEWASLVVLEEYSSETLKKYNCQKNPIGGSDG